VNCQGFQAKLHDYFHGSLPAEQCAEVDRHAAECPSCGGLMKTAKEISCRDFVSFLDQYLGGELSPARRAVFERHLAICPDCKAYLDSYMKTTKLSVQALRGSPRLPEDVPDDLVKAILAARRQP
jgi:anti-sigma factor RsiW